MVCDKLFIPVYIDKTYIQIQFGPFYYCLDWEVSLLECKIEKMHIITIVYAVQESCCYYRERVTVLLC